MAAAEDRLSRLVAACQEPPRLLCRDAFAAHALHHTGTKATARLDVFLEWLRRDGTDWSRHPTREDAMREYARIWTLLGSRQIEDLVELPLITDPEVLDTLDVFSEAVTPSFFFDEHLSSLVVCRLVSLSLEYGNCDASCYGYAWLAISCRAALWQPTETDIGSANSGYDLVEKRGLTRYQARTYLCVGALVMPWTKHPATGQDLVRRAFDTFDRAGELAFAGYCFTTSFALSLAVGEPLAEVQAEAERGLAFSRKAHLSFVNAILSTQLGLTRTLRGLTATFGRLDHEGYDELDTERHLASNRNLGFVECLLLGPQAAGAISCRGLLICGRRRDERATSPLEHAVQLRNRRISALRCARACGSPRCCLWRPEAATLRGFSRSPPAARSMGRAQPRHL